MGELYYQLNWIYLPHSLPFEANTVTWNSAKQHKANESRWIITPQNIVYPWAFPRCDVSNW